jgi:epidermal growth factor receptor substrate 15
LATAPTTAAPISDNHDWDAIFAGLDAPTTESTEIPKPIGNGTNSSPVERPQLGRALTEAGVHDDPILKNLTGMGYPRKEALAALEKYDYNLERVSASIQMR